MQSTPKTIYFEDCGAFFRLNKRRIKKANVSSWDSVPAVKELSEGLVVHCANEDSHRVRGTNAAEVIAAIDSAMRSDTVSTTAHSAEDYDKARAFDFIFEEMGSRVDSHAPVEHKIESMLEILAGHRKHTAAMLDLRWSGELSDVAQITERLRELEALKVRVDAVANCDQCRYGIEWTTDWEQADVCSKCGGLEAAIYGK